MKEKGKELKHRNKKINIIGIFIINMYLIKILIKDQTVFALIILILAL